jgi:DNA-binding NtrC family response regulator
VLRKEPFQILTAHSAADSRILLRSHRVDVVVSDESMPGVSGSKLLSQVRTEFPNVVRIMLTGEARADAVAIANNDGFYPVLSKPIRPHELARLLREALHVKRVNELSTRTRPAEGATPATDVTPIEVSRDSR